MTTVTEALWIRIHPILTSFAEAIAVDDPTLIRKVEYTVNESFVLRGYLAFRRQFDGDELAITVDARIDEQQLTIESDACDENGGVLALGPIAKIPYFKEKSFDEGSFTEWLHDFRRFLELNELIVKSSLANLS